MPINEKLYKNSVSTFKMILNQNNVPSDHLNNIILGIDEQERVRLELGNIIFYSYDLTQGDHVIERYNKARESTMTMSQSKHFETYIVGGTIATPNDLDKDIIGWYITQV